MCQENSIRDPLDGVQYRLFLIPEFEKKERSGLFILKAHHSFADGLAAMQFFGALSDEFDSDSIVGMKPIPFIKRLIIWICLPIVTIIEGINLVFKIGDRNAIKRPEVPFTGKKNGWYSNDLNVNAIKKYSKNIGNCTVNDYTTALLSTAMHEYFVKHTPEGEEVATQINAGTPFSLREAPSDIKNVRLNNQICCITVPIRVFQNFDDALNHFKSFFNSLKKSLLPFGNYMVFRITTNLPFCFPNVLINFVSNKHTMIYSNLNASKKPLLMGGQPSKGNFYFVPSPGKINMGVSIVTIADKMRLSIYADESSMPNLESIKELIGIYERQNIENLSKIQI